MTSQDKMAWGNGGVYGSTKFENKPDAIRLKYRHTAVNKEKARIIAYLWKGTFKSRIPKSVNSTWTAYKDWENIDDLDRVIMDKDANQFKATTSGDGELIASLDYEIANDASDWETLEVPFSYSNKYDFPEKMNVIISAGDYWNRPGLQVGSTLDVDDVNFVYYSELSKAEYDNRTVAFNQSGEATVHASYNANLLSLESNGIGATIQKSYNANTGLLTIVVTGNDISENEGNYHVYTIQFDKPLSSESYQDNIVVNVTGMAESTQESTILVYDMPDGTKIMSLNDFKLQDFDMNVGNIVLTGLRPIVVNNIVTFASDQTILITEGYDESVTEWIGPSLGLVPVVFSGKMAGDKFYCNIDIDMQESLGQTINVVFGKKIVPVTETAAISAEDAGEAHVVLDRAFNAGWNTVCLPFAYTASEIAEGAEAQEFKADHGSWLTFDVVDGQLEPNKPYLINVPTAVAAGKVFENKTIVAGAPASVSNGAFTFTGVYEQKDMNGFYGVATVDGETKIFQGGTNSKIMGTRAYFECSDKSISSVGIAFNGETTSISTITAPAAAQATGVYNVQGIKLNNTGSTAGLPAGLYIVNGQKVLVK